MPTGHLEYEHRKFWEDKSRVYLGRFQACERAAGGGDSEGPRLGGQPGAGMSGAPQHQGRPGRRKRAPDQVGPCAPRGPVLRDGRGADPGVCSSSRELLDTSALMRDPGSGYGMSGQSAPLPWILPGEGEIFFF